MIHTYISNSAALRDLWLSKGLSKEEIQGTGSKLRSIWQMPTTRTAINVVHHLDGSRELNLYRQVFHLLTFDPNH